MNRFLDQPHRQRVLYVEDHAVNVMLMKALFERRPNLELVAALDGQQALALAAAVQPALLLVDLRLPDCHGTELLPRLRQLPGCQNAPAVAVTAEYGFDIAGTGFDELWLKPMDLLMVLKRLDALLGAPPAPAWRPALRMNNFSAACIGIAG